MNTRAITLLCLLLILAVSSFLLSLYAGSLSVSWAEIIESIHSEKMSMAQQLVQEIRLPRAISAFITGALLALSGALLQALLRNPLADPYVLGISGGAAAGALFAILMGLTGLILSASAFAGAFVSMLMVFGIAHGKGSWTPTRLLLTGIVIAAGWGAITSFLLVISPDQSLRSMLFWLMGDLGYAETTQISFWVLIGGLLLSLSISRSLNIISHGELQAAVLGINLKSIRIIIYLLASLMTATAVTLAGSIGFIGLVVPHLIRLMGFPDYRILLPASVLFGGSLLILADTLSRTIIAPQQLPVGVISAAIGVPMFLYLLYRGQVQKI